MKHKDLFFSNQPFGEDGLEALSNTTIFFILDNKCNNIYISKKAREVCGLNDETGIDLSASAGLCCTNILEGFPPYDCPPRSFGISHGYLKTGNGKVPGTILYYPLKDEGGKIIGSIWNFVKENTEGCSASEEAFWATRNNAMSVTMQRAVMSAKKDAPITILGETGTGKTELAKFIHQHSSAREFPFIHINCSTIPETLFESELFGYEKGAFTGASTEKNGYIAFSDNGVLFLDEISALPLNCQAKLLTFLDTGKYRPLGSTKERTSNVRIISSSNRPLWEMTKTGEFRLDLFFRLSVVRLFVPPLRERKEDIPSFVNNFLRARRKHISPAALKQLISHPWPGNIRELFSVLESACICSAEEEVMMPEHLCLEYEEKMYSTYEIPYNEKQQISAVLDHSYNNRSVAAKMLGLSRTTLWRKMKKYNIEGGPPGNES